MDQSKTLARVERPICIYSYLSPLDAHAVEEFTCDGIFLNGYGDVLDTDASGIGASRLGDMHVGVVIVDKVMRGRHNCIKINVWILSARCDAVRQGQNLDVWAWVGGREMTSCMFGLRGKGREGAARARTEVNEGRCIALVPPQ